MAYNPTKRTYQFAGEAAHQAGKFDAVRDSIFDWLKNKRIADLTEAERNVSFLIRENEDFGFAQFERGGRRFFALKFTRARDGIEPNTTPSNAALKITTEVVLRADDTNLEIHIVKLHTKRKHARIKSELERVKPPSILDAITPYLTIETHESLGLPFSSAAIELDKEDVLSKVFGRKAQPGLIHSANRLLPIFVAHSPNGGGNIGGWDRASLDRLAHQIYGFGHVVILPNADRSEFFNRTIAQKWRQGFDPGMVRRYEPHFSGSDSITQHAFLPHLYGDVIEKHAIIEDIASKLLEEQFDDASPNQVITFDDVYGEAIRSRLNQNGVTSEQEVSLLRAQVEILERQNRELETVAGEFADSAAALETKCNELEVQLAALKEQIAGLSGTSKKATGKKREWEAAKDEVFGIPVPKNIKHVKAWAEQYFPDSLVLSRSFVKECESMGDNYARSTNFYRALAVMGIYYGAHHDENLKHKLQIYNLNESSLAKALEKNNLTLVKTSEESLRAFPTDYTVRLSGSDVTETSLHGMWDIGMHVKDNSTSPNPNEMLRLYIADSESHAPSRGTYRMIVGSGPTHKRIIGFHT